MAAIDLVETQVLAVEKLKSMPMHEPFHVLLQEEKQLCTLVAHLEKHPDVTSGSKQLITEIANQSEMRCYKIKQRITNGSQA